LLPADRGDSPRTRVSRPTFFRASHLTSFLFFLSIGSVDRHEEPHAVVGAQPAGWYLDERAVWNAGWKLDAKLAFVVNHPGLLAEAAGEGPLFPRPAACRTQISDRQG